VGKERFPPRLQRTQVLYVRCVRNIRMHHLLVMNKLIALVMLDILVLMVVYVSHALLANTKILLVAQYVTTASQESIQP